MGMGFAPTWLRQVSPPPLHHKNHFNHCLLSLWQWGMWCLSGWNIIIMITNIIIIVVIIEKYVLVSRGFKAQQIKKGWWAKGAAMVHTPKRLMQQQALNIFRAIESRWKTNFVLPCHR